MACGLPCVDLAGGSTEAELGRDGAWSSPTPTRWRSPTRSRRCSTTRSCWPALRAGLAFVARRPPGTRPPGRGGLREALREREHCRDAGASAIGRRGERLECRNGEGGSRSAGGEPATAGPGAAARERAVPARPRLWPGPAGPRRAAAAARVHAPARAAGGHHDPALLGRRTRTTTSSTPSTSPRSTRCRARTSRSTRPSTRRPRDAINYDAYCCGSRRTASSRATRRRPWRPRACPTRARADDDRPRRRRRAPAALPARRGRGERRGAATPRSSRA